MANPRKFSEKIALQKQKQAEGTAEFEKIMKEVSDATTSKPDDAHYNQRSTDCNSAPGSNKLNMPQRESRGRSIGVGPMRRPSDRKVDRSPYSSGAYLSPPSDSGWRRASSDSAIHQSLIQNPEKIHGSHSPISHSPNAQRRTMHMDSNADHRHYSNSSTIQNLSNLDVHHMSSCGFPRHPGVNIYPSTHENSLSAPIGNNTGSLPDLTSVHFASPINIPLEKEPEQSSSPFSSSPLTTSPATLSPTSMPNRYQYSPVHSPSDSNTYSPTHFSSHIRQDGRCNNQYRSPPIGQSTTHLSFTNLPGLVHLQQNNLRQENISINNTLHGSHGNLTSIGVGSGNLTEYRTPQCRASPASSPGLTPIPTNESNPSAPCSPVPQNISNSNSHTYDKFQSQNDGFQLTPQFQNNFEQFSLVDNPSPEYNLQSAQHSFTSLQFGDTSFPQNNTVTSTSHQKLQSDSRDPYNMQQPQSHQSPQHHHQQQQDTNSNLKSCDTRVRSHSQSNLVNETQGSPQSHNQLTYQSPTTPTSIPEIVFSDFSSGNTDFSREIFGSLDLELGPMDVAGMLSDPNSTMISDQTIEDSFRRDLN